MRLKRRAVKPPQSQRLPFTETQIRERAYQLWQANPEGSAEAHWEQAIRELERERSLRGRLGKSWQTAFNAENRSFSLDVVKVWISGFGVLATVFAGVGLYLTYQNTRQEQQLNSERLVTDRFAKAVEQLGSPDIDVRIGAVSLCDKMNETPDRFQITV